MTSDDQDGDSMENWKQFQGTELGSLLGQIYGNQNKPKIQYPKFKTNSASSLVNRKDWLPGGGKADAVDPRKVTRRSVQLPIPRLTGHSSTMDLEIDGRGRSVSAIDVIPKRKGVDTIKQEMEDIKLRQERFRPAHVKPISSDAEKDRLNQIFTFHGGKGLPTELTHPLGEAPFERTEKQKEKERIEAIKIKRGLSTLAPISTSSRALSINEQMADQITEEVNERRKFLEEMKGLGALKAADERRIKLEIASKLKELDSLL